MTPEDLPPPVQLMKFIVGKWISKPIYAAAVLGIADICADGPKTIQELAQATGTQASPLYRMMRALASVGIFSETEESTFSLTPMAELLKSGLMRSTAILFNGEWNDRAWSCFLDGLKTGNTPFETAHGETLFAYLAKDPFAASIHNAANSMKAAMSHRAIVDAYDFSNIHTLADIGAGEGVLAAEILQANPGMTGVTADLPHVVPQARKTIASRGMETRLDAVACDFFASVPQGYDAYVLSHVLHDFDDADCGRILKNCRLASTPDSRLLVVEIVIPSKNVPSVGKLLDLEMFVMTGGRERTETEYEHLFSSNGFRLVRVIPTNESISVIEGIPERE